MAAEDEPGGVGTGGLSEPEGYLGVRLIPAGTPEPEKTRLQKVLLLLEEAEADRNRWKKLAEDLQAEIDAYREEQEQLGMERDLLT